MELNKDWFLMSVAVILISFIAIQGSYGFSISEDREIQRDADDTLLNLIQGIYNKNLHNTDKDSQKRGQGWAISYGKRASPGWSIAYGKRNPMEDLQEYSNSRPNYIITKRATPFAMTRMNSWNPTPNKRQQGWHIAYGKRFVTPLYRR